MLDEIFTFRRVLGASTSTAGPHRGGRGRVRPQPSFDLFWQKLVCAESFEEGRVRSVPTTSFASFL